MTFKAFYAFKISGKNRSVQNAYFYGKNYFKFLHAASPWQLMMMMIQEYGLKFFTN